MKLTFITCLYVPATEVSALHTLPHWVLTATLWDRYDYCMHFAQEKIEARRDKETVSSKARIQVYICVALEPMLFTSLLCCFLVNLQTGQNPSTLCWPNQRVAQRTVWSNDCLSPPPTPINCVLVIRTSLFVCLFIDSDPGFGGVFRGNLQLQFPHSQ